MVKANNQSIYERWLEERNSKLNRVPQKDREKIEEAIETKIRKNMEKAKKKSAYFSWNDLLSIKEVKKHFRIFSTTGDRNIGKTTSSRRYLEDNWYNKEEKFIWIRSNQEEIKKLVRSEASVWWNDHQWEFQSFTSGELSQLPRVDSLTSAVGYYVPLSTSANVKGIEYPKVSTIIYDEFNTDVKVSDKYNKLTTFIITAFRHNPNTKLFLMANFVDQDDELLQKFGVGMEELTPNKILHFNWITQSIMWFIPDGMYMKSSVKDTIGHDLAVNDFATYKQNYGGTFKNSYKYNIINLASTETKEKEFMFNIKTFNKKKSPSTIGIVYMYDKVICECKKETGCEKCDFKGYKISDEVIVASDDLHYPDGKSLTLSVNDSIAFIDSDLVEMNNMQWLYALWKENQFKTDKSWIADLFRVYFEKMYNKADTSLISDVKEHL